MKKICTILSLFILISFMYSFGTVTAQDEAFRNIGRAISAGNASALLIYLDNKVDMNVNGKKNSYSKNQAQFILKDFFNKYPPKSFEFVHKGASDTGLRYAIGKYSYGEGTFRVVLRTRKVAEDDKLYNLDFSKE